MKKKKEKNGEFSFPNFYFIFNKFLNSNLITKKSLKKEQVNLSNININFMFKLPVMIKIFNK